MARGGDDAEAPPARASVPDLFARLTADARAWIKAEIALLRTRGTTVAGGLKSALILLVAALALASVALIALGVGLVLMLTTLVGPGWATLIVVATFLAFAGLLGWLGVKRAQRAFQEEA